MITLGRFVLLGKCAPLEKMCVQKIIDAFINKEHTLIVLEKNVSVVSNIEL